MNPVDLEAREVQALHDGRAQEGTRGISPDGVEWFRSHGDGRWIQAMVESVRAVELVARP